MSGYYLTVTPYAFWNLGPRRPTFGFRLVARFLGMKIYKGPKSNFGICVYAPEVVEKKLKDKEYVEA